MYLFVDILRGGDVDDVIGRRTAPENHCTDNVVSTTVAAIPWWIRCYR